MKGVKYVETLDGKDNEKVSSSNLQTLDGKEVSDFIDELTIVNLHKDQATEINFEKATFEDLVEQIKRLTNQSIEDSNRIHKLVCKLNRLTSKSQKQQEQLQQQKRDYEKQKREYELQQEQLQKQKNKGCIVM